jgi:replication factor C small subunit
MGETAAEPAIEVYWQRHMPREWKEVIGDEDFVQAFQDKKIEEYINCIFAGPAGTGKSLGAYLIDKHTFCGNSKTWNCSGETRKVEEIETSIINFCKKKGLDGIKRSLAVLQEADGISTVGQKSLRVPMEAYAKPVVFILTVNFVHKIIDPVQSRACVVKFELANEKQLREFADRIIQREGIKCTESQINAIIRVSRGQFRKVANTIQGWTTGKTLYFNDQKALDDGIDDLFDLMMKLDLDGMIAKVERLFSEYNSDNIVIRLAELVKSEEMPQSLKTRSLKACTQCLRDIVDGVDVYISFYNLCAELIETMSMVKRK